jgi:hypothetical protein
MNSEKYYLAKAPIITRTKLEIREKIVSTCWEIKHRLSATLPSENSYRQYLLKCLQCGINEVHRIEEAIPLDDTSRLALAAEKANHPLPPNSFETYNENQPEPPTP